MNEPRCIRIFKTFEDAKYAQEILAEVGIKSQIHEDGFEKLKLRDLGMQSRFRFYIEKAEIKRASLYLVKKLKERRLT